MHKIIRDERGDMTFFSIMAVLAINIIVAFVLLFSSVQIHSMNIRNGIKMELNNLSASIYADTYHSQRESNLTEYLNTLYSSAAYTRQLEAKVVENLQKKIELENDDYRIRNISLSFSREPDRIRYVFHCDLDFYIRMFGHDYPAITRQISLTGYHNTKF